MSALAILQLVRRFWWAPVIVGLALTIAVQRTALARKDGKLQHAADVMALTTERINRGVAKAQARDLAHARRIERLQDQATQETGSDYAANLDSAQRLAAAYALRLRNALAQADYDAGGGAGHPSPADPADPAAGSSDLPQLDDGDFRVCTTNTVKAISWRAWWQKLQAIPRE